MSARWKTGMGLVAFVIAVNVLLALIHSLSGGTPGGPTSSSYATGPGGAAAYASLLGRAGHRVQRIRGSASEARLDAAATVVLLDPERSLSPADSSALRSFVHAGGRLVVGGAAGSWLAPIVPGAPSWSPEQVQASNALAPSREIAGVRMLEAPGSGSWEGGSALPLLGDEERALLAIATVGAGRVWLLANTAPLRNRLLDEADDAALGLALAGPRSRPVAFLEGYHGYGAATGFAAVPGRWWVAFGLLAFAAATLMLASGRRFGPPQRSERELPPPRREYVEALGGVLARTRRREDAIRPVRIRIRGLVDERAGLRRDASDDDVRAAAVLFGVPGADAAALARPALTDADVIAVGRVLARLEGESGE